MGFGLARNWLKKLSDWYEMGSISKNIPKAASFCSIGFTKNLRKLTICGSENWVSNIDNNKEGEHFFQIRLWLAITCI